MCKLHQGRGGESFLWGRLVTAPELGGAWAEAPLLAGRQPLLSAVELSWWLLTSLPTLREVDWDQPLCKRIAHLLCSRQKACCLQQQETALEGHRCPQLEARLLQQAERTAAVWPHWVALPPAGALGNVVRKPLAQLGGWQDLLRLSVSSCSCGAALPVCLLLPEFHIL